jgi:hypothetical protein
VIGGLLPPELIALVTKLASRLGEDGATLIDQARSAVLTAYSPTILDVSVSESMSSCSLPDGPIPGRAIVYDGSQVTGEILLWVRSGRLIGLEQAWFTDEPPSVWPTAEIVRIGET